MEQRRGSIHDRNGLPFGRAMKRLHELVVRADKVYEEIQQNFDQAANPAMGIATEDALVQMWQNHVEGKQDSKLEFEGTNDNEAPVDNPGQIADMDRDLTTALQIAFTSMPKLDGKESKKTVARLREAKRLQQRVETVGRQILELLAEFSDGPESCVALRAELENLKTAIDPTNERNKILFKSPADDVDDNASMAGNNGQERV